MSNNKKKWKPSKSPTMVRVAKYIMTQQADMNNVLQSKMLWQQCIYWHGKTFIIKY